MYKRIFAVMMIVCLAIPFNGCKKVKETDTNQVVSEAPAESMKEVTPSEEPKEDVAMVTNGDFSKPNDPPVWFVFSQGGGGSFAIKDEKGDLTVSSLGSVTYGVQLYQDIKGLTKGCKYKFSFDISASKERTIEYRIQMNGGDYHAYAGNDKLKIGTESKTETLEFQFDEETDPAPRLVFNCGMFDDTKDIGEHDVYFDNVKLELIDDSGAVKEDKKDNGKNININQLGYLPDEKKVAVFRGKKEEDSFDVVDANTDAVVYTGKIENKLENETAGEINYYGDFSDLKNPGTYKIKSKSFGESYPFSIGADVYDSCYADAVKMLYRQRCGCDLDEDIAGEFAHKACHTQKAKIYGTNKKIDVTGGWHDAGDYGRYVVAGAKTVMDLFLTVDLGKDAVSDSLGIPESGNKVPDLLDEARWELNWMLKMQDKKSGGVYHKVTCANFPGDDVMPEDEKDELIVSPISTAATYDFAAVMAKASELYKVFDEKFAKTCESAAKKAMAYAEKQGLNAGFKNPKGIVTGEYPDSSLKDERFWAAAQMYRITGEKSYIDIMDEMSRSIIPEGFGWQGVGDYGTYEFLTTKGTENEELYQKLLKSFLWTADQYVKKSKEDGYHISLGNVYNWGSNSTVANNAMHLILANQLKPNGEYIEYAREHMNYCMGTNPMSISYVTGYGSSSPVHVHHRPSYAVGESMPGMLVGGPDKMLEDPFAKAVLQDTPPAKCYVDNHGSYSTNEVTIYWNSPFIFVLSELK